jgi:hypothetical protein
MNVELECVFYTKLYSNLVPHFVIVLRIMTTIDRSDYYQTGAK